eukprot:TRINITY_DN5891_c0_g1_i1.p1 TRINITY_DN5891_c0_g1~~TRINITY_DN5891_c0_g1_i1.p1  ORF type:complete len:486 (+),score=138.63 TRINITY_DN5891_c0_g1_i1:1653-3110(+)
MSYVHADSLSALQTELRNAGSKPVIVDFWATWCGPCRAIAPTFESLARTHKGKAVFVKVDVDKAKDAAQEYGVSSMPTFIFFHRGTKQGEMKGADANGLTNSVNALVKKHNVFSQGTGHSLVASSSSASTGEEAAASASSGGGFFSSWFGGGSSAPSSASAPPPAGSSSSGGSSAGARRNPWADPNFVPPYLKQVNPDASSKLASSSAPAPQSSDIDVVMQEPQQDVEDDVDEEMKAAIALSLNEFAVASPSAPAPVPAQANELSASETKDDKRNDPRLKVNQDLLSELLNMGFPQLRAEKALILTKNADVDTAVTWLVQHGEDADIDEPLQIVDQAADAAKPARQMMKGEALGVRNGEIYEDGDEDLIESIKKKALADRDKLKKVAGLSDKSMAEMTKEEKVEYIDKLRLARREQKKTEETVSAKQKEIERRERVKQAMEIKRKREQEEAERAARIARREREAEKERRRKIREKIAADKDKRGK